MSLTDAGSIPATSTKLRSLVHHWWARGRLAHIANATLSSVPDGASPSHEFTDGVYGHITHTDLASSDPAATRRWCETVLGWSFRDPFPSPVGEYHLFAYSDAGGGGVRAVADGERPGATPTVHVPDADAAYAAALAEGAESLQAPSSVMPGARVAQVREPGGVVIGFSGPTTT